MGTRWTADHVLSLAPDPASRSAGRTLGSPAPWTDTGASGPLLWGHCQGSGKTPYRTIVHLAGPAYRCSCPSRKLPCKHAIGLLLLWSADEVPDVGEPSGDAAAWSAEREARVDRASGRQTAPKDPEQSGRTAARRRRRVESGLDELEMWLQDQVRDGISGAAANAYARFDPVAARLIDAQAPGPAGVLRRLPQVTSSGSGWPGRLLRELGLLHLLTRAHARVDQLPAPLAATVRQQVGYPMTSEEVLATPGVRDSWQVVGASESSNGSLTTRRTWLWGASSDRPALILTFGAARQAPDVPLPAGTSVEATLHFHPGSPSLRGLLGERHSEPRPYAAPAPSASPRTLKRLLDDRADAVAANPWTTSWPGLLDVRPARRGGRWALLDDSGESLPVTSERSRLWPILALSGGDVVTVAVELVDRVLVPFGAWPKEGTP